MKRELCWMTAVLACPVAAWAQSAPVQKVPTAPLNVTAPPPVKMGLWENTIANTMSGFQLPPDVVAKLQAAGRPVPGATPRTTVTQSCMTADSWQKDLVDMQQKQNCQITNVHQSATAMSGDMACTSADGTSKGHMEATFASTEKMNGKVHLEIVTTRQPQPIVMDVTFNSVYQGSDCKGISPDSPKIIH